MKNETTGLLGRDAILAAAAALKTAEIEVPQLGGKLRIRELGAFERDVFDEHLRSQPKDQRTRGTRALLIMLSAVNDHGEHLFAESDLPMLNQIPGDAANVIANEIAKLSVLGDNVEKLAKNSESSPSESSSSASPEAAASQA